MYQFTPEDWKTYKKERGLTNADVATILGLKEDSVKQMTRSGAELPTWAIAMLYEWQESKKQLKQKLDQAFNL